MQSVTIIKKQRHNNVKAENKKIKENRNRNKNKAMKTRNNVQKAVLRSAAVIVSFVLISLTVSAHDFWKKLLTNSSFNEIALAMTETSNKPESKSSSDLNASENFVLTEEKEEALHLEGWMVNESNFSNSTIVVEEVTESKINVEDWMMDEEVFESSVVAEPEFKVEDWMTSDKVWNI